MKKRPCSGNGIYRNHSNNINSQSHQHRMISWMVAENRGNDPTLGGSLCQTLPKTPPINPNTMRQYSIRHHRYIFSVDA
jgi:hypothetical protein